MKNIVFVLLVVLGISSVAMADDAEMRKKLVGEWSGGGANLAFESDGSGRADTGICQADLGWSVSGGMLAISYKSEPKCAYNDYQIGQVAKKMPKPADETVRFTIEKSSETGFPGYKLKLFNKNAPQGVPYFRADMGSVENANAPKLSRTECNKAMTDEQRACDMKGGNQYEVMVCRNGAMAKYIDCL